MLPGAGGTDPVQAQHDPPASLETNCVHFASCAAFALATAAATLPLDIQQLINSSDSG